jgi:hypothetical protein
LFEGLFLQEEDPNVPEKPVVSAKVPCLVNRWSILTFYSPSAFQNFFVNPEVY